MKTILKFTTNIRRKSELGERIKGWHAISPIGASYTLCGISFSDENGEYIVKPDHQITCNNCVFIISECEELKSLTK